MLEIRGPQQSDAWLRARCGRITGSRLPDVCNFVWKGSKVRKDKRVEPGGERRKYLRELICERLTGLLSNHWQSEWMAHGEREEEPARMFYEEITRRAVIPVSFVIHPDLPFTGASADGLVGEEGVIEIKNPETTTHIGYYDDLKNKNILPKDYIPQMGWEMACAGKERRWADFMSFDRRVKTPHMVYVLRRVGRDELEWSVPIEGAQEESYRTLTGEAVIDYFTEQAVKLNAEIEYYFKDNNANMISPFKVDIVPEEAEPEDEYAEDREELLEDFDRYVMKPAEATDGSRLP